MSEHQPKFAALEALDGDLLSPEGRRRISAHVERCSICRDHLEGLRAFDLLRADVRRVEDDAVSAIDWQRIDARLAAEARELVHASATPKMAPTTSIAARRRRWVGGAAVIAAAAAAMWAVVHPGPRRDGAATRSIPLPTHATASDDRLPDDHGASAPSHLSEAHARLSHVSGDVTLSATSDDDAVPAFAGITFESGILRTGTEGTATLEVLGTHPGRPTPEIIRVALSPETSLSLEGGRPLLEPQRDVRLRLSEGRVEIDGFESSSRVVILASDARIELQQARVLIELDAIGPHVVVEALGEQDAEVLVEDGAGQVRSLSRQDEWPAARVDAEERAPEARTTTRGSRPDRPRRPSGTLSREEVVTVVRTSLGSLERCYDSALRVYPDLGSGVLQARVTVDPSGAVRALSVHGESVPPILEQCIRREADGWRFSPPGHEVGFELPLRFRSRP